MRSRLTVPHVKAGERCSLQSNWLADELKQDGVVKLWTCICTDEVWQILPEQTEQEVMSRGVGERRASVLVMG